MRKLIGVLTIVLAGLAMDAALAQPAPDPAPASTTAAVPAPDPAPNPAAPAAEADGGGGGDEYQSRIVGGRPALAWEAPWQVEIFDSTDYSGLTLQDPEWVVRHRCGGAWLGDDWVVTAAHCLYVRAAPPEHDKLVFSPRWLTYRKVRLGTLTLSTGGEVRAVRYGIMHARYPGYYSANHDYDVALVKLAPSTARKPPAMPYVPATLAPAGFPLTTATGLLVTGWGRTSAKPTAQAIARGARDEDTSARPDALRALVIKPRPDAECSAVAGADKVLAHSFCAAADPDPSGRLQDQCSGDSGGPVTHRFGRADRMVVLLVGLVSWGRGCAQRDEQGRPLPGFYTAIGTVRDWLDRTRAWADAQGRSLDGRMLTVDGATGSGHAGP